MKQWVWLLVGAALAAVVPAAAVAGEETMSQHALLREVPIYNADITGGFWGQRRTTLREVTMRSQWEQLEAAHHVDNFRIVTGRKQGVHLGPVYIDSDLYKWLEAASYVVAKNPEEQWLRERVEEVNGLIAAAQMPDGYINTYYESFAPEQRFTNLWMNHELYCAGHFIEAACAQKEAAGSDKMLAVAQKFADLIAATFGPGRNEGVPGHEEVELALIRLYRLTGVKADLDTAEFFINQRGRGQHFVAGLLDDLRLQAKLSARVSAIRKSGDQTRKPENIGSYGNILPFLSWMMMPRAFGDIYSGRYYQNRTPLVDSDAAEGHAVRAMYFYTGATDLYIERDGADIRAALERIWDNTFARRAYITGGLGAVPVTEGFGRDYELPNNSYTETCAAIGSIFWGWRMLRVTGDGRYADQMERAMYNGALSGISLSGDKYFYRNPLSSRGKDQRPAWYGCACCPPNIARLLASLEKYLYSTSDGALWVHQYATGRVKAEVAGAEASLEVTSGLPWDGIVEIKVNPGATRRFALKLRLPAWSKDTKVALNGEPIKMGGEGSIGKGYLTIDREWQAGDKVELTLDMTPRFVTADPKVAADRGRVTIMRGPLVYCLEGQDNPGLDVHSVKIDTAALLSAAHHDDLLNGVTVVLGQTAAGTVFTAIPYYSWANRGPSQMEVWVHAEEIKK